MNYRDPQVLRDHIQQIIDFYHPACIDRERGGYINQFTDDGTIYDRDTKHLVGTCRFVFNYAVAAELFERDEYRSAAAHGMAFLQSAHRQAGRRLRVGAGSRRSGGRRPPLLRPRVRAVGGGDGGTGRGAGRRGHDRRGL